MRQEKFLGIPITVVNDDEVAREAERDTETVRPYIVMRVKDDIPGAMGPVLTARRLRTLCEKCGELCYVDPKCLDTFRALPLEIICMPCFVKTKRGPIEASSSAHTWEDVPPPARQDKA